MAEQGKRRAPGEGSIHQRSDGRWVGVLSEQVDGERRRRYIYGHSRREVINKLRRVDWAPAHDEAPIVPPLRAEPAGPTGSEFVALWSENILPLEVRTTTVQSYGWMLRKHFLPTLGHLRLPEVTPAQLQALYSAKRSAGLSARSVALLHSVVRRMLGDALRHGHVTVNVASSVRAPRVPKHRGRTMTPEEARRLLKAAEGHLLEAFVLLGLTGGLRPGETLALRWDDLDLDRQTVHVQRSLTHLGGGRFAVGETKTQGSVRAIGLPASTCLRLSALPRLGEHVLSSSVGTRMDPNNVRRQFKALTVEAGIGNWHPHELRHSAASLMLAGGVPLHVVANVLGHSSVAITGDVYAHLLPTAHAEAAGAVERMLSGPGVAGP